MQHILQQTYSLQTYTLASCIRTTDDKNALFLVQFYLERYNLLSLFLQGECEKGMLGKGPVDKRILGCHTPYLICQMCFGTDELYIGQELVAANQFWDVGAKEFRKILQDAYYLAFLLGFQFPNVIVDLYHLGRFYEDSLTC